MAVTKDRIVASALDILDTWGLADLSMRRIADGLGVQAASIYWHFANKQALLAAVSDAILADVDMPQDSGGSVADAMADWAGGLRTALLAHRDGAELVASTMSTGMGSVGADQMAMSLLLSADVEPVRAVHLARAWTHFVVGHVMQEQTAEAMIRLGVIDAEGDGTDEATFVTGVELLREGLRASTE